MLLVGIAIGVVFGIVVGFWQYRRMITGRNIKVVRVDGEVLYGVGRVAIGVGIFWSVIGIGILLLIF